MFAHIPTYPLPCCSEDEGEKQEGVGGLSGGGRPGQEASLAPAESHTASAMWSWLEGCFALVHFCPPLCIGAGLNVIKFPRLRHGASQGGMPRGTPLPKLPGEGDEWTHGCHPTRVLGPSPHRRTLASRRGLGLRFSLGLGGTWGSGDCGGRGWGPEWKEPTLGVGD